MPPIIAPDTEGLNTHSNDLSARVGSTSVADNVVFTREGRPERRPGFKDYSTNLSDYAPQQLLVSASGDQAYMHFDNGLWYHDGTRWLRKRGAFGAKLGNLSQMWLDTSANVLYAADSTTHVVYAINLTTGGRTIFAGRYGVNGNANGVGGAARFDAPAGLWGDDAGNLYVSDFNNSSIRKIVIATATVSNLATGVTQPRKIWGDGAGTMYVVNGYAVSTVTYPGGTVTVFAGDVASSGNTNATGTSARFETIAGLWGTGAGTIYASDGLNNAIRAITYPGAVVTTLATVAGPVGLWGIAGTLYIASANRIQSLTYPGASQATFAGSFSSGDVDGLSTTARFNGTSSVIGIDGGKALLVFDISNSTLRKIYFDTAYVSTIAGMTGTVSASAQALFADGVIAGPD